MIACGSFLIHPCLCLVVGHLSRPDQSGSNLHAMVPWQLEYVQRETGLHGSGFMCMTNQSADDRLPPEGVNVPERLPELNKGRERQMQAHTEAPRWVFCCACRMAMAAALSRGRRRGQRVHGQAQPLQGCRSLPCLTRAMLLAGRRSGRRRERRMGPAQQLPRLRQLGTRVAKRRRMKRRCDPTLFSILYDRVLLYTILHTVLVLQAKSHMPEARIYRKTRWFATGLVVACYRQIRGLTGACATLLGIPPRESAQYQARVICHAHVDQRRMAG